MTIQNYGTFGFLNPGQLPDEPLLLLDFGIEKRQAEPYDFNNNDRDYDGYLFQYTFQGRGIFERDGISSPLLPGTAFFSLIPEKADIICRKRNRIIAGSISMSISRVLPPCLFPENQGQLRVPSFPSVGQRSCTDVAEPA